MVRVLIWYIAHFEVKYFDRKLNAKENRSAYIRTEAKRIAVIQRYKSFLRVPRWTHKHFYDIGMNLRRPAVQIVCGLEGENSV